MRTYLIASLAALSALSFSPALALDDDDDDRWNGRGVSRAEAIQIARGYGLVRVKEVERDDDGWKSKVATVADAKSRSTSAAMAV